ncbi:hypothetical protein IW261DRAFT_13641 [Armillaria novae-zelandiae]|uniref:Protein kinase domain-containing protein n=1 Tax=Armillaria novae-zelandiae TaxID=153914 RepID=A0AA39UI92_9AGAR|nr:hypothetical protein IW261DRAFT_13641 [Armillaria novae-zelandiae]
MGRLHFIVEIRHQKRRREDEEKDSGDYLLSRYKKTITANRDSPSSNSRPSNYMRNQASDTAILDGRYDPRNSTPTAAPPVQLYHPVFADFLGTMDDTSDLPEDLVVETGSLMRSASGIAVLESSRSLPSRTHLSNILGFPLVQSVNLDKKSADHTMLHSRTSPPVQTALLAIVEEKSELGSGGDVTTQGGCSYTAFWLSRDHQELRECSCCPSFIICLTGPWMVVMGAVFTTQPIVQRLTDFVWLGTSPIINDVQCIRVSGILRALKAGIRSLDNYYRDLEHLPLLSNAHHPRFFPFPTFYNVDQSQVHFKYLEPLKPLDPDCITFLAETILDKTKVVVKFAQTYGVEAHGLLAQHNLAPPLLHFKHLNEDGAGYGALKMVVMGYVEGMTASKVFNGAALSPNVVVGLERAINILHGKGLVFGDLRRPNIMIMPEDNTVQLIDFDWAGKENEARYPIHLNESKEVKWADGVGSYQKIDKKHDLDMLKRLRTL